MQIAGMEPVACDLVGLGWGSQGKNTEQIAVPGDSDFDDLEAMF